MLRGRVIRGGTIGLLLIGLGLTAGAAANPVPFIGQPLSPTKAFPGSAGLTLTVNGTGFVPGSQVRWNGAGLPTVYVSGERLTAKVPASALISPSTAQVTVLNPAPGGGYSNFALFEVTKATPAVLFFEYDRAPTPDVTNSLVAGDFNGDGKLDIAAAMGTNIAVLLGNGDGTFKVSSFPTTAQFVGTLVAGDFNGDGKLDLAFSDPFHNLLHTLLGNGDGTFAEVSTTAVGSNPSGIAAGDFNGDGKLDLAVANQSGANVFVLLGNGDGTFSRKSVSKVGSKPNAVTVGDFNGDGQLDLAVVNSGSNTLSILLGAGDGTFILKSSPATGASPYSAVASDFNGDGRADLAVTNTCGNATSCKNPAFGSVTVLLGVGDGTFTSSSVVLTDYSNPRGIVAGDLNADGKTDLVVTGFVEVDGLVLLGDGKGGFAIKAAVSHQVTGEFVVMGDFDGDGRLDFAMNNSFLISGNRFIVVEEQVPVAFYPAPLRFPPQTVGTTSPPKTMKFSNLGIVPVNISKKEVYGFFAGTNDCPAVLPVGASCTFSVTFTPGFVGLTGGSVSVTDDALGVVQTGWLEGRGK